MYISLKDPDTLKLLSSAAETLTQTNQQNQLFALAGYDNVDDYWKDFRTLDEKNIYKKEFSKASYRNEKPNQSQFRKNFSAGRQVRGARSL